MGPRGRKNPLESLAIKTDRYGPNLRIMYRIKEIRSYLWLGSSLSNLHLPGFEEVACMSLQGPCPTKLARGQDSWNASFGMPRTCLQSHGTDVTDLPAVAAGRQGASPGLLR